MHEVGEGCEVNVDALFDDNASLVVRVREAWEGEMGKHVKP